MVAIVSILIELGTNRNVIFGCFDNVVLFDIPLQDLSKVLEGCQR